MATTSDGARKRTRDLSGQKFNKWQVISFKGYNKRNQAEWLCKCECGTLRNVLACSLIANRTKSCGCARKEPTNKGNEEWQALGKKVRDHNLKKMPQATAYDNKYYPLPPAATGSYHGLD